MKIKTIWNERFGMLMASGSPGSALAYQLGNSLSSPDMMRRNTATGKSPEAADPGQAPARKTQVLARKTLGAWLRNLFDRFEAWTYAREMREIEAYLAQAQNHADLEARMRHLHDDLLSRARALR
jgi:hypothetical protein